MCNHRLKRPNRIKTIEVDENGKEILVIKYEKYEMESSEEEKEVPLNANSVTTENKIKQNAE